MTKEILVGITTTKGSDWQQKIRDIEKFGIKRCVLFLTCLNKEGRAECYKLLEEIEDLVIPFCHMKSDMTKEELVYLMERFKTEKFNCHVQSEHPFDHNLAELYCHILVENTDHGLTDQDLEGFAGICLDTSHLEDDRLRNPKKYEKLIKILDRYPIGANHVNAILKEPVASFYEKEESYDFHTLYHLSELDYLKSYPDRYFGKFIALEMENDIEAQLKAKEYLSSLIKLK